jgi:hypothetical protein
VKKTPKAPEPEPEPKAPKNTMTEEQKRQLSDYVCEVVKVELHPYLKRRIIESKGEFKHIARKVTKEIASREHIKNIDNQRTAGKIRDFVKKHMKHVQKVKEKEKAAEDAEAGIGDVKKMVTMLGA